MNAKYISNNNIQLSPLSLSALQVKLDKIVMDRKLFRLVPRIAWISLVLLDLDSLHRRKNINW